MCTSCVTKGVSVRLIFVVNAARRARRAPRRPRTGRRARGPARLTLRDRRAPHYNVTMNGYSGGTAAGGPILGIRPGDGHARRSRGGGDALSGRNNNKRSLESEKNMSRKYAARAGAVPDGAALAPPAVLGRSWTAPRFTRPVVVRFAPSDRG
jgi:hypothetical protein